MNNFKLLILFGSLLFAFASCEPEDIEYPGEKENKALYAVNLSSVLSSSSFFSSYIANMEGSGDAKLSIPLAENMSFAAAHILSGLDYFVPTGDLIEGTLITSDLAVEGGESSSSDVLVYYYGTGEDSVAYQISNVADGFRHEGFHYNGSSFDKVLDALDNGVSGKLDSLSSGTVVSSTTWEYVGDSIEFVRTDSPNSQSSILKLHGSTMSGRMMYYEESKLISETTWTSEGLGGIGTIYDANGNVVITDEWPLIPVPENFDTYRMLLFQQDGFHAALGLADAGNSAQADVVGAGTKGGWKNLYDEVLVQAAILMIPDDAVVDVNPSGLKRTYTYTAISGESIEYLIQATTPAYKHVIKVDGSIYFEASESRDSPTRETFLERQVSLGGDFAGYNPGDGLGACYISQAGTDVYVIGRGSRGFAGLDWAYNMTITPENAVDWIGLFDGNMTNESDVRLFRLGEGQEWVGGDWADDAASGNFIYYNFAQPNVAYPW